MKKPSSFARRNPEGLIEIVDEKSGQIVAIQSDMEALDTEMFIETLDADGNKVLLQKGINPNVLERRTKYPFSNIVADLLCQRVAEGETLKQICNDRDMPSYDTICKWRRENEGFKEALEDARQDRAEFFHDKAVEAAYSTDEGTVQEAKLRHDADKWAAGVGDAEMFGSKTKIIGDKNAPLAIMVDTGIRRPEDYHKDEAFASREVEEVGKDNGKAIPAADDNSAATDNSGGEHSSKNKPD